MSYRKIEVPFKKLQTIHHFADIHIRNLKRHVEYREVFSKVYKKIKQNSENSIIYVGGDIAHAKLDMSPELVDLISEFFKNLADIAPTVVITGNHDCNLNNLHRLDVLQPIVRNLNHPDLHYIRDTEVVTLADTTISVMSVFDEHNPDRYPLAKDIKGDTKIAFFHGTVDRCSTDFGFTLPSDVKITLFDGYDMALLGDIHKRQFLNKEKTIGYCGSLIQQNHGELLEHGFLTWDVPSRTSTFNKIDNDYGYYTLDVKQGVVPDVKDMPKKARLRVRVSDTTPSQVKSMIAEVYKKYNIKDIVINRTDALSQQKTGDRTNKIDIGDVGDVNFQNELIEDYLKRNFVIDDETLDRVRKINDDINHSLPPEEISRNVNWKLKKFEFDNMFSYGEGNEVDFTNLNGISGLFAPNASGKSALLDAVTYCLFDICSRAVFGRDILNNKKHWFKCRLNFEINGTDYIIERRGKLKKNGHVKVDVDFWVTDDSGEMVSMNGDQRRTTNVNIKRVIGTYDDFILTALSLQTNGTVFIDKTQKERKEILAQFMDMNIFDKLYTLGTEQIHDVASLLRSFKKEDFGTDLGLTENALADDEVKFENLKEHKEKWVARQKKENAHVLLLNKKLKPIDKSIVDIDSLQQEEKDIITNMDEYDEKIEEIEELTHLNKDKYLEINNEIQEVLGGVDEDKLTKDCEHLFHLETQGEQLGNKIELMKRDVKFKLEKVDRLKTHEYDPNCDYCVKNPFVVDAMKTKDSLEDDKQTVSDLLSQMNEVRKQIQELEPVKEKKESYDKLSMKMNDVKHKQQTLNKDKIAFTAQKSSLQTQLESIEEKIIRYYENEEIINENRGIQKDIDASLEELVIINNEVDTANADLSTLFAEISVHKTKIESIQKQIDKVKDLEDQNVAYEYYLNAVQRDGVPYELITKVLPTIETEVNDILSQIVDFNIILEMDGKNVNTRIVYDEENHWPLELSSGMERFISALAIRVALISVSNLPRPDFLAIDEGFGVLDSENLNSLAMLFDYLKTQFKFLMVISHIDAMKDLMDTLVEIKKENGYSSVKYLA